jgi:hypothetical protein
MLRHGRVPPPSALARKTRERSRRSSNSTGYRSRPSVKWPRLRLRRPGFQPGRRSRRMCAAITPARHEKLALSASLQAFVGSTERPLQIPQSANCHTRVLAPDTAQLATSGLGGRRVASVSASASASAGLWSTGSANGASFGAFELVARFGSTKRRSTLFPRAT